MEPATAYNLHCSGQHDQLQEQLTGYHYSFSSSLLYPNDLINQNSTNYDLNICSNGDAMGGGGVVSSRQGLMNGYCGGGDDDDAVLLQQYSSNFPSKLISHDEMILHNPNNNGLEESSQHYSMSQSKNHENQYRLNRTTTLGLSSDDDDHIRNSTTHRGQQQEYAACFSRILPSINISSSTSNYNSNSEPDLCFFPNLVSNSSSSLDLNLQAKDHLMTYAYHHEHEVARNNSSQSSQNANTTLGRRHHHHPHHLMQQELIIKDSPSNSSNNNSFEDGVCKIKKRPNINISKSKNHVAAAEAKKQRSAPRLSCLPLKVRKEKLGDRIATLQRLVAPYGKTDTASVLTEAIGYIQFLHDQVQTLSVPYGLNKSSNNKPARTLHEEHKIGQEQKDLRSRGLCLVPLSSASFLHGYNTGI